MKDNKDISGIAALSICESLLLALNDHKLLSEHEIIGVLKDAASAHEGTAGKAFDANTHQAVAALINQIIAGGNSIRHP
ncbi:hypothetical protein [Sneathiella limimaris]|uniref:hypothetical protein n=1 Tax=Sneathiella limimaris TaxID=1964213 RepID=UPI00146E7F6E|nr:hypothetical protein [Sneathiella limimaris]